ncbi:hypothetical protein [Modestobacter versicolor]|uniref:Uncharacterized protein n=1 Tax=Modestobacter versicolor TaxID=429133 RepID=A0A323VAA3_9ACTN|nr:hypothetical protein [Modestobacter versicolor]MBB3674729.1 hypothetical protein [Modestobacter versicolor]PZA21704.1 hypothetical protein DMO24_08865 [Modestobacter versicolor]
MAPSGSRYTLAPIATRVAHPLLRARSLPPAAVAHAVHGLVLFVAVVGATYVADYPARKVLLFSTGAVVLFWVAHVYAAALAHQHEPEDSGRTGPAVVAREARRALPLLEACVVPALPLVPAALGLLALPLAYAASVTIGIVVLAAVGFAALHARQASVRRSLAAAAATGGIGAVIIAAETFWH